MTKLLELSKIIEKPDEFPTDDFELPDDNKTVLGKVILSIILGIILGLFVYVVA